MPVRSKFSSSCLRLLRPSCKFSTFTHNGAKTYVAKEDCFCLFSLIFFLPKFHMEKITLIKPTWSSGKASVIPLMCLHTGHILLTLRQLQRARTSFLTTYAFGRKHMMVTTVLLLRRIAGPKAREGTLHPSSFRVMAVSMGNAISWQWAFWRSGGGTLIVVISRGSTSI